MKDINSKNLFTERLELKITTMDEQRKLWSILRKERWNII